MQTMSACRWLRASHAAEQCSFAYCRCELEPNSLDVGDVYYCTTKALHLVLKNVGQVCSILWGFPMLPLAVQASPCEVVPQRIKND